VLDADWRNATSFATCSSDNDIHLCKLGSERPIKTWTGHSNEVRRVGCCLLLWLGFERRCVECGVAMGKADCC